MSERFVVFSKPRVRDASGAIYALVWDRELEFATKGTGRTTPLARRDALAKAQARAEAARQQVSSALFLPG